MGFLGSLFSIYLRKQLATLPRGPVKRDKVENLSKGVWAPQAAHQTTHTRPPGGWKQLHWAGQPGAALLVSGTKSWRVQE